MIKSAIEILILVMLIAQNTKTLDEMVIKKVEDEVPIKQEEVKNEQDLEKDEQNIETIKHVTKEDFEKEVLKSKDVVLVDFYAEWCNPCKKLAPVLEEIAKEHDEFKIVKVNEAESRDLITEYDIKGYPTLIIMQKGEEKERILGGREKDVLIEAVHKYMK